MSSSHRMINIGMRFCDASALCTCPASAPEAPQGTGAPHPCMRHSSASSEAPNHITRESILCTSAVAAVAVDAVNNTKSAERRLVHHRHVATSVDSGAVTPWATLQRAWPSAYSDVTQHKGTMHCISRPCWPYNLFGPCMTPAPRPDCQSSLSVINSRNMTGPYMTVRSSCDSYDVAMSVARLDRLHPSQMEVMSVSPNTVSPSCAAPHPLGIALISYKLVGMKTSPHSGDCGCGVRP